MNVIELTSTRHNEMVDPVLHVWGWEIPVYLFLGGWVAGMMILSGVRTLRRSGKITDREASLLPLLGLVLLSLGMLALFLDLEHKSCVLRLYTTFEPASPMSWGAWILLLVYPVLAAGVLLDPPAPLSERLPALCAVSAWLRARPRMVRGLAFSSITLGVLLGTYTGVLLSALGARPLWSSPALGLLFLASGLSAAAAFIHLIARDHEERAWFARLDSAFLGAELFLLGAILIGLLSSTQAHMRAAELLLGGPYSAVFWVGVVFLGVLLPLLWQLLAAARRVPHSPVFPILVILGGLLLRFVIVDAGQHSRWFSTLLQ